MTKSVIYFHIAAINKYQEIFDEIYAQIVQSKLIDHIELINFCIVGNHNLVFIPHEKIRVYEDPYVETGEFFTLNLLKTFSDSTEENYKILYIHTKGATAPNNPCVDDWRQYMTYFNVVQHQMCFNVLDEYDACGVDLITKDQWPHADHFSGTFWWANSLYIKKLPTIDEIKFPKTPPIISIRHNGEFWIGMGNGRLKSLWNSNINLGERHLHRYPLSMYSS